MNSAKQPVPYATVTAKQIGGTEIRATISGEDGVYAFADPPTGNNGSPGSFVCNNGSAMASDDCANEGGVWYPDLRTSETVLGAGILVKF